MIHQGIVIFECITLSTDVCSVKANLSLLKVQLCVDVEGSGKSSHQDSGKQTIQMRYVLLLHGFEPHRLLENSHSAHEHEVKNNVINSLCTVILINHGHLKVNIVRKFIKVRSHIFLRKFNKKVFVLLSSQARKLVGKAGLRNSFHMESVKGIRRKHVRCR